jgi:hypothetical protein
MGSPEQHHVGGIHTRAVRQGVYRCDHVASPLGPSERQAHAHHTPTIETNILPGGTAFCVDVGMTGPSGGMMGYTADPILRLVYSDWHGADPLALAPGPVVLGAVAVTMDGGRASGFERISPY